MYTNNHDSDKPIPPRIRRNDRRLIEKTVIGVMLAAVCGAALRYVGDKLPAYLFSQQIFSAGKYMLISDVVALFILIAAWLFYHGIHKGLKYVIRHRKMMSSLKKQLYDAKIYVKRFIANYPVAMLSRIIITFSNNYKTGEVRIKNTIGHDKIMKDINISPALGNYVVEQTFTSADQNWWVFDIRDSSFDRQLTFENCSDFRQKCASVGKYDLLIDEITTIPIHHSLICGQTGSGKSYAVNGIIYQMLAKPIKYNLYFADPKQSGLSIIGNTVDKTRTANSIDTIIELIKGFHNELDKRKKLMESKIGSSLNVNTDFRTLNLEPFVLVFEEYLAFSLSLANYKKEVRDEVAHMLSDVVLMGRQNGFFLFMVMQSAPSTQIPTFIRDQMVFKVVLGNSDESTYTVTFDRSADIPTGIFSAGYGVYTYAGMTEKPKILAFPTIRDFDIIQAISEL